MQDDFFTAETLRQACEEGDHSRVTILVNAGVSANQVLLDGSTPLHVAARRDSAKSCLALIRAGADPNALDRNGKTPLEVALPQQMGSAVVLLRNGARIDPENQKVHQLFLQLCHDGKALYVQALLEAGVPANLVCEGRRAACVAAQAGRADTVALLHAHGADLSLTNELGMTPLAIAVARRLRVVYDTVVELTGFMPSTDWMGNTLLHHAADISSPSQADFFVDVFLSSPDWWPHNDLSEWPLDKAIAARAEIPCMAFLAASNDFRAVTTHCQAVTKERHVQEPVQLPADRLEALLRTFNEPLAHGLLQRIESGTIPVSADELRSWHRALPSTLERVRQYVEHSGLVGVDRPLHSVAELTSSWLARWHAQQAINDLSSRQHENQPGP